MAPVDQTKTILVKYDVIALFRKDLGATHVRPGQKDKQMKYFGLARRTLYYRNLAPLSPTGCWPLIQTGDSNGKQFKKDGIVWKIEQKLKVKWRYRHKIGKENRHCLHEEIMFVQLNTTDKVCSATGKVAETYSRGRAVSRATTYVWQPTRDFNKVGRNFQLGFSDCAISENQTAATGQLCDVDFQLDF